MCCQHGLGALQMRVAGQYQFAVALGGVEKSALQLPQPIIKGIDGIADPEFNVGDDLIVATAAGVQLASHIAQSFDQGAFDVRVNIFQLYREFEMTALDVGSDGIERRGDGIRFFLGQQANLGEHTSVGLTGANVVPIEPAIDADRFGEGFDARIGVAAESAAPGLVAHDDYLLP